ncbi:MAG: glycoside hydrolase family 26 protein, partial [Deltaproteobacteria bacterium]
DVLNGKYDAFLVNYARQLKAFGHPVLFRLNNEMNGDWCSWCAANSSTDTELYRAMWRYIYGIFKQQGADNALWVWNPNELSFPGFKWNSYINYFPGSDYVDIIGLTGYNTGNYYPGERWRDFRTIYDPLYWEYSRVFNYPFMITEFGCNKVGGDKPAWIRDMFQQMPAYKNIKLVVWFNGIDYDVNGNPARTYRMDQDAGVLQEFAQGLNKYNLEANK